MEFALVDLKIDGVKANREHTGGFGSFMRADGFVGGFISSLKAKLINLPVMSFAFTSALLKRFGHKSTFYSQGPLGGEDIIIIASSMHCYRHEVAFAKQMKQRWPKSRIGFYGPFAQTKPEFFEADADFIIGGELESTILAFLEGKHDFLGKLDHGQVKDLTSLPLPDWSGMPVHEFSYSPMLHRRPMLPIQSSRGCSFNCDFCPYMVSQTKQFRCRRPNDVVDEMERNVRRYHMRSFLFRDICYTLNKKHAAEISEEMLRRGLDLEWGCETRLDCLTTELVDLMVKSGLKGVNLGIESSSNEILRNAGKKNPEIEHQEFMVNYLKRKGVRINGFFMLGLPGDTVKSMNDTIAYAARLNTQGAQFCITTPFPGTPLFESQKERLLTSDFTQFNEYLPVVDIGTATPSEVRQAHARAFRQVYLRPSWLLRYGPQTLAGLMINRLGGRARLHAARQAVGAHPVLEPAHQSG